MKKLFLVLLAGLLFAGQLVAQDVSSFKVVKENAYTPVKNQQRTGTCWSYATTSFLESELLRMGKGEYDLAEMYFVRNAYPAKAKYFVELHGHANFDEGGQAHDVLDVMKKDGVVPQSVYPGNLYHPGHANHTELKAMMKGMLEGLVSDKMNSVSMVWADALNGVLDAYMGKDPENFQYNGKTFTPESFMQSLGLDPNQYVEITSYTHHPFYQQFSLEVPDNWSHDLYYNVPEDDIIKTMDHAIMHGYTVVWDGDVSDKGFSHRKGLAVLPDSVSVNQEARQNAFLTWKTTDDHLMHIVGIAKDADGNKYYITKNSWSATSNAWGGMLYMSERYVRLNTIAITVNRNSIPQEVSTKIFKNK
jgi:bleomycin hydrolase